MGKQSNVGTYTLSTTGSSAGTGVYTILAQHGVYNLTVKLASGGSATVTGAAKASFLTGTGASTAVALVADEPTAFCAGSETDPIDNLVITVISGTVTLFTNQ